MAQTIGAIILAVLALVALAAVLNFILGLIGTVFFLIPLLIRLAIFAGILYLAWMVFRKLARSTEG